MMDINMRAGLIRAYTEHVMGLLGYKVPNVPSGEHLIHLVQKCLNVPFEEAEGFRTEPPFPGAGERPAEMRTGWRMICACKFFFKGVELGVFYMTFVSGRPVSMVINAPGTLIPAEYLPVGSM